MSVRHWRPGASLALEAWSKPGKSRAIPPRTADQTENGHSAVAATSSSLPIETMKRAGTVPMKRAETVLRPY
jgi:hypothetical protein